MSLKSIVESIPGAVHGARRVAVQGLEVLKKDIAVTVYSVFVFLLLLLTIPLVNSILLAIANGFANQSIFNSEHHTVKVIFVAIAVFASAAVAAMLLSYFACAVAASTLAQLEGHPAPLLKGLKVFKNRFRHISKFALISIAYIPIGFMAQRKKIATGTHINRAEVFGSSLSLSTAQLAPAILYEDKGVYDTIQHSVETLGKAWREGIVIKVAIYTTVIFLTLLIGIVPTLVQAYVSESSTSQELSRLLTILLIICLLLTAKVLGTVFSATLYWQVKSTQRNKKTLE
jgi:uncharacterized Tic20 family protein